MSRETAQAALIGLSAGTAARRVASRGLGEELAASLDWDALARALCERRLLPQLGERIIELSGGRAPTDFAGLLERTLAQTRRQAALLELVAVELTRSLADAGIDALILKGVPLGAAIYGDAGRRAAGDIDLLVAAHELRRAAEIATRTGYGEPSDELEADGLPRLHLALAHRRGELPPLELHWRVHWYERAFATDMLAGASAAPDGLLRAAPVDELLALLLFYARDGFLDLRLATDIGAWWDALGDKLARGALGPALARYPALAPTLLAATAVAERVVGLPGKHLLGGLSVSAGRRVDLAARLANPDALGDPSQQRAEVSLVDALLCPRGERTAFIRRRLLPSRRVLAGRARLSSERRVSPPGHAVRVLARYGLTAARLATASSAREGAPLLQAQSRPLSSPRSTSSIPL